MFGIIVSGRLVQTEAQQVNQNQFLFNIPEADNINHVVVFMTGQMPFPDGLGGAGGEDTAGQGPHFGVLASQQSHLAQIGISVEPLDQLAQQTPITTTCSDTSIAPFVEFSGKMLENFFNYASSFGVRQAEMTPNPSETYVPLSTLQKWYENFQRRLQQNPNFWKS